MSLTSECKRDFILHELYREQLRDNKDQVDAGRRYNVKILLKIDYNVENVM